MGEALHPRRVEILRYLAGRASVEGPPPSVREIGAAVGLSSSQTVHHHLGRLEEEGYVMRVGRGGRRWATWLCLAGSPPVVASRRWRSVTRPTRWLRNCSRCVPDGGVISCGLWGRAWWGPG